MNQPPGIDRPPEDQSERRAPQLRAHDSLLRVEDLVVEFPTAEGDVVHAVSGLDFDVATGETLGLVGESGCGKSTTGRAVMCLPSPTAGSVEFDGTELTSLPRAALRRIRAGMQMIFQDPISSLNPRRTVAQIVAEPLSIWKDHAHGRNEDLVAEMLEVVGIDLDSRHRRPQEFSGGQCQRISIARALMLEPKLLICDEPVSSLDVSIQAQILGLLEDLKQLHHLSMIFISHDLAVVRNVADRVAVMYLGRLCEIGDPDAIYEAPAHPYTEALMASVPQPDPSIPPVETAIRGELPSPINPPSGCRFRTRCPRADRECEDRQPPMRQVGADHFVACHHPTAHEATKVSLK